MSRYSSDSSQCSSGTGTIPRKRRRVETTSSPNDSVSSLPSASEWETTHIKRELEILRTQLSQTEATLKIKKQKEKLIEQEKEILEKRVESDTEMIQQLMKNLKNIQSELSQVKISMEEQLKEMRSENFLLRAKPVHSTCGRSSTPSQKFKETQKKMEAADQRIIDLSEQFDRKKIELDEAKATIKELNAQILSQERPKALPSMNTRVEQLEEELRAAKVIISTLRGAEDDRYALEEQIHCLQKRLDQQGVAPVEMDDDMMSGADDLQENDDEVEGMSDTTQVMIKVDPGLFCQDDSSNSIINDDGYDDNSSPGTDDGENSSSKAPDEDEEESPEDKMQTQAQRDLRAIGGRCHALRPTNPKFFDIDWDDEYQRIDAKKWACLKCPQVLSAKGRIQDHVWGKHYGQEFQCSHCAYRFKWRSYISVHMKKEHPGLFFKKGVEGDVLEEFD